MTKLSDVTKTLGLTVLAGQLAADPGVTGAYCGDMLSDVMANAARGNVWITIQIHMNIVPVAVMKELAAIIVANGKRPEPNVLAKARQEGVPMLGSPLSSFQIACRLHEAGVPS
jgi:predicted transcriptional regulator